jgi:molybdopterin biosynthesis enzyme
MKSLIPNPYPDNYSIIVKNLLDSLGFKAEILGIIHDDIEEIKGVIIDNIDSYDAIAIIGGASRGMNDKTGLAIEKTGEMIFHATNLSPGKVSGLAKIHGKPVFIVPAHIGSAVSCIYNIMIPILSNIYLDGIQLIPKVKARLTTDVDAKAYSYTIRTVSLRYGEEELSATPHIKRLGGSTLLTILSQAQGYILLPPGSKASKGDIVEVNLFSPIETLSWEME